uniref:Gamma-tubulin complex component n=1 Tax=Myxobolus squamalis TaxID=59785 RepID=A0A6B2G0H8_MYXSQ
MSLKNIKKNKLIYNYHEREYLQYIDSALLNASKTLLNFIIKDKKFLSLLSSIRHYFLLDSGDFFVIFFDLAESTLIKPKNEIDILKLESLLELAIRNSIFSSDPFSECVGIILLEDDLETNQLNILGSQNQSLKYSDGIRSLAFTYNVEWPLSLIINEIVNKILKYIFF